MNKPAKSRQSAFGGAKLLLLALICFSLLAAVLLGGVDARVTQEQADLLSQALNSAAVDCYACEGRYPATLEYLCKNYGVYIDEAHYHVTYDIFAANVIPQIQVTLKEAAK